ncbi:MAG: hypothetical protein HN368_06315, partial [Spirochaetales bacterium]|nr:hypothetical protein [Spirochaetales bacterium]
TQMYGKTDTSEFSHIEGHEDHSVNLLFTYDDDQNLTGMIVNVPCPSQCTENELFISADYWHETRDLLRARLGEKIFILPQCSAAGDLSPRELVDRDADVRMLKLRGYGSDYGFALRQHIAVKISEAVEEVFPLVEAEIYYDVVFTHRCITVDLPARAASESDFETAKSEILSWKAKLDEMKDSDPLSPKYSAAFRRIGFNQRVVDIYHAQKDGIGTIPTQLHVLRIGDIAMATNRFEYYLDFGERIKAGSPALQTFVVQLAGGGSYLPTEKSMNGGSYGAIIASAPVGPEGGQMIVEKSLEMIREVFS